MTRQALRRGGVIAGIGAATALVLSTAAGALPGGHQPSAPPGAQDDGPTLELGIEALFDHPDELALLEGKRIGLITNPTGVDHNLTHSMDLLIAGEEEGDYELTALYAPEHGILGGAPAGAGVESYQDPRTGLTVWSLYGETQRPTEEMLADVDVLLFDIQDIGARFYTYIWTMYYAMDAAAEYGKEFIVLDRPNPLGDRMDGPILDESLASFVGLKAIPMQHGLTVGELASYFNGELLETPVSDFHVVTMDGYDPDDFVDGYGLPWVLPSPNIPTIETAWAYAGMGLIESLNASEGRGTTTPFLWTGHPDIDEAGAYALAEDLNSRGLEGVTFRPMFANPTTSKQAGKLSGGVNLHITDPASFVPVRTGLHVVSALFHLDGIDWREGTIYPTQSCETEADVCWIDRLTGDKSVRMQIEAGVDPDEIIAGWQGDLAAFDEAADPYRLYQADEPGPGDADAEADADGTDAGADADATDAGADADGADAGSDANGADAAEGTDEADGADSTDADDAADGSDGSDGADGAGADAPGASDSAAAADGTPGDQDTAGAGSADPGAGDDGGLAVTGASVGITLALALLLGAGGMFLLKRRRA